MNTNRTTAFTYNADGKLLTLTARNSVTGDQVTRFVYGTTLEDSGVASNDLLRAKIYPDSDDGDNLTDGNDGVFDRVEYSYNRLGEMIEAKDQAGTVHAYDYDKLGRITHDRVTNLGPGVDDAVLRISREYEVRGMLKRITSYDSTNLESATVVNQVELAYNDFGQLATDKQSHAGAVGSETPVVSYDYADGSANTIRPSAIAYPNERDLTYDYGTTNGTDDVLSRISGIKESTNTRVSYTRLGLGQVVKVSYPEPGADMTYIKQGEEPVGDAGDQYTGLDRFGRVEDIRWLKSGNHLERVQHGYDRAGNKRWRKNLVAASGQDEFYNYDGLYQLTNLERGTLNVNRSAIAGIPAKEENFDYDPTGNWQNYQTKESGTEELDQTRTHNKANETWQIDGSNATVAYDPAGNMVKMPSLTSPLPPAPCLLTWDAWNRLVKIAEGENTVAEYAYDGLFRRTKKITSGNTRHFYYSDKWQIVEERLGSSTSADRQFLWGLLGIDDLLLRDRFTSGSERLYALHDTMHVTAIANTSGTVQERYGYDAFGNTRVMDSSFNSRTSSNYDWETRFCGYRWDGESGLYQVRYRYLHSGLGRWLQNDLSEYEGSDLNLYRYCGNEPVAHVDEMGLLSMDKIKHLTWHGILEAIRHVLSEAAFEACERIPCRKPCDDCCITVFVGAQATLAMLAAAMVVFCVKMVHPWAVAVCLIAGEAAVVYSMFETDKRGGKCRRICLGKP